MPLVQLPDGQRLQFPDDMSEPDMAAAISKNFPQFAPEKSEGILDRAQDAYHAVKDELTPKPDVSDLATTASKTATVPGADAIHVGDNGLPSFSSDRQMDIGVDNAVKSASTPTPPIQSQLAQNQNSDEAALGYLNSDKNLSEDDKVQDASRGIIDHARPYVDKSISDTLNEIPKGLAEVGDDLGLSGALATSTIAKPMDWAYQYFTNNPDTPVQDAVFRNLADPFLQGKENNAVDQDTGFGGKLAHTVGGLGGMMIEGFTTGGAALEKNLAEGISKALIETGQHAFAGMALPAATAAVDIGRQVYEKTGDMTQASNAMAATALTTVAAGAFPMSAGGKLAQRMATGAVTMPIVNEATHPFEQSALPDSMKSDRTWQDRMLDMVTGAGFASLPHAHAPEFTADRAQQLREQMGYKPDTELQPLADQKESLINEIKSDPLNSVKAISDAPTVEDAIKAANEITTRPVETPKGFENVIDQTIADTVTPDENKVEPTVDYKVDEPAKIITPIDNRVESKPEDLKAIEEGVNNEHVNNVNREIELDNAERAKQGLEPRDSIEGSEQLGDRAYDIAEVPSESLPAWIPIQTRLGIRLIAAAFGKKVKYLEDKNGQDLFFRGAYGGELKGGDENTLYLNAKGDISLLSVVGHELGHALRKQAPDVYSALEKQILPLIDQGKAKQNLVNRKYGTAEQIEADFNKPESKMRQETISDFIGDHLTKPKFLLDLALKMSSPQAYEFFKHTADTVRKALDVLNKNPLTRQSAQVMKATHDAVLEALAEYKSRIDSGAIEGHREDGEISFAKKDELSTRVPSAKGEVEDHSASGRNGGDPGGTVKFSREEPTKVMFEVAPDPRDKELKAEWDKLPAEKKSEISVKVQNTIVPKVLKELGATGKIVAQHGGWMEDTNPSFVLEVSKGDPGKVAKGVGHVLSQEGMFAAGLQKFDGAEKAGIIEVVLGKDASPQLIHDVYTRARSVDPENITGHSTVDGSMHLVVDRDLSHDLANKINDVLKDQYEINRQDGYKALISDKEYGYASERGSIGEQHLQESGGINNLRAEASQLIRKELGLKPAKDEGTKYADSESIPRDKLSGRKVTVPYLIRDTGETAHMKMDAKEELDNLDSREDAMKRLEDCLA